LWQSHGTPTAIVPEVADALRHARAWAGPAGLVCACGSFFVVAEVREALGLAVREPWPEPVGEKAIQRMRESGNQRICKSAKSLF